MLIVALKKHPASLVFWLAAIASTLDTVINLGNQTRRFQSGQNAVVGKLPVFSIYRFGRFTNQIRRDWTQKSGKSATT